MTSADDPRSADPDPASTTGLEPGGGVPPGETPPGEASTVAPQGHEEGRGGSRGPSAVWLAIVAGLVLLFAIAYVVGRIVG